MVICKVVIKYYSKVMLGKKENFDFKNCIIYVVFGVIFLVKYVISYCYGFCEGEILFFFRLFKMLWVDKWLKLGFLLLYYSYGFLIVIIFIKKIFYRKIFFLI